MSIVNVTEKDTRKTYSFKRVMDIQNKLKELIQPIIKEMLDSGKANSQLFFDYQKQITDLMHTFIELFYRVGIIYANKGKGTLPKQTDLDNEQIRYLTDYSVNLIFKKIFGYNDRETLIDKTNFFVAFQNKIYETFDSLTDKPKKVIPKSFNIEKQISSLIQTIAFLTLNTSVILKRRQLLNANDKNIIKYAGRIPKPNPYEGFVVWVTAKGGTVCPQYCVPLRGRVFDITDTSILIPVVSTHPNCRCRLMTMDKNGKPEMDVTGGFIGLEAESEENELVTLFEDFY
jgi:hypothetical protein